MFFKYRLTKIACATLLFPMITIAAPNPASQQWVLTQLANNPQLLTAAAWNSICTTGSATSASGCYGNVASSAFAKVNNALGGFTRYANITPANVPASVFVKAFLGGTNTPAQINSITVQFNASAGRCVLFTQVGLGVGPGGVNTDNPASGTSSSAYVPPTTLSILSINNTSAPISYSSSNAVGASANLDPVYLLCVGYNTTDGSSAAAVQVTAT